MATKPIPIRIPVEWLPRIAAAATKLGTNRAALIAFCAKTFTSDFEKHEESGLPPNWREIFARLDGRTTQSHLSKYPAINAPLSFLNEKKKHPGKISSSHGGGAGQEAVDHFLGQHGAKSQSQSPKK